MAKIDIMSMKKKYIDYLQSVYPDLKKIELDQLIADELIAHAPLVLPRQVLNLIQDEIHSYQKLRQWGSSNLKDQYLKKNLLIPDNQAICTSYDFHYDSESSQPLKLIEINTNAAFLALGLHLYEAWQIDPQTGFNEKKLAEMFRQDAQLSGLNAENLNVTIIDDQPQQQRLFIEFLVYQQLLQKNKISTTIESVQNIDHVKSGTYIYNRHTDFYLEQDISKLLRERYNTKDLTLSPQPWDYFLLADKQRMFDWNQLGTDQRPKSLLKIYDLAQADAEQVWSERKNLFFKPKSSFGSKQAYKGGSMSRKVFDVAMKEGFIAQEFAPPAEYNIQVNTQGEQTFKYDLRCYAYQNQLQLVIVRFYQGQTTNLKTLGGGFAVVDFK